jgi:hypothetical protein
METNEIEMQLWEYLDGACTIDDMSRISVLIVRDPLWKAKFEELAALHNSLGDSLELEQPSLRFTQNVMDAVATTHVATATKKYINKGIIRSIAALFGIMLTAILGYAIANSKKSPSNLLTRLNLKDIDFSALFNSPAFNIIIAINVVIGLVFLDAILRRKKAQHIS